MAEFSQRNYNTKTKLVFGSIRHNFKRTELTRNHSTAKHITYARIHLPLRRNRASLGAGLGFLDSSCVISSLISALVSLDALRPRSVPYKESASDLFSRSVSSTDSMASSASFSATDTLDPLSDESGPHSSLTSLTRTLNSGRWTAVLASVRLLIGFTVTRVGDFDWSLEFEEVGTWVLHGNWVNKGTVAIFFFVFFAASNEYKHTKTLGLFYSRTERRC